MSRILLRLFIIFLFCHSASSQRSDTTRIDEAAFDTFVRAVNLVDHHEYEEALRTFETLIKEFPDHPIGYFGSAATYQTVMRNYRMNLYEAEYDSMLNTAIDIGAGAVTKNKRDAVAWFYLGGAYGFRGLYKVRKHDWVGAFADGLKGVRALERALDLDPTLYDAYYGLGLYHYWRSAKGKVLGIPIFFARDKEKGIREIWKAIEKGRYSEVSGKYALVATYYDNEEYEKAWTLNQELYERFPTDPSCLYMRSRLAEKRGDWKTLGDVSRRLLNHIRSVGYPSIGYEMECYFRMALSQYHLELYDDALINVNEALALKFRREASREIEGPLEDFQEIAQQAETLRQKILRKHD